MKILDKFFGEQVSDEDTHDPPSYNEALSRGDFTAAAALLKAAIAREDARAMGAYAAMCALGCGVEKDPVEAYLWFLQGATRGDVRSQVALGMCLAGGVGTPLNRLEGAYWLYRAGKAGSMLAIEVLGALAYKDNSIVGPHFSEGELIGLCYQLKKSACRVPASNTVH